MTGKRQDTRLESEGAEFLVLGHLLIEGISGYKAYVNFPGYDLVAVNPDNSRVARIQVKSRWATDYDGGFPIRNFDCDFVVHVALNRGYRFRCKTTAQDNGIRPPDIYVFPVDIVRNAQSEKSRWGKAFIRHIPDHQLYQNHWRLIADFLGI
jgi:hypothetical protein